jgi:hypothetical protein
MIHNARRSGNEPVPAPDRVSGHLGGIELLSAGLPVLPERP